MLGETAAVLVRLATRLTSQLGPRLSPAASGSQLRPLAGPSRADFGAGLGGGRRRPRGLLMEHVRASLVRCRLGHDLRRRHLVHHTRMSCCRRVHREQDIGRGLLCSSQVSRGFGARSLHRGGHGGAMAGVGRGHALATRDAM